MVQKYLISFPNVSLNLDIIPDINDLLPSFTNPFSIPEWGWSDLNFPFPPTFQLPDLPDLPAFPSFPGNWSLPNIDLPSWTAVEQASALLISQLLAVVNHILDKLKAFGQLFPLSGIFPITLPQWSFSFGSPSLDLSDLMQPNPLAFLSTLSLPDFDFNLIPNIPNLWPTLSMPDMSAIHAFHFAIIGYLTSLLATITGAFNKLISYAKNVLDLTLPSLPSLPTMPSLEQILEMLPEFPTIEDLKNLFGGSPSFFNFPGWEGFTFALPDPLIPDMKLPEFEFTFWIKNVFLKMISVLLGAIVNWITNIPFVRAIIGVFPLLVDLIGSLPSLDDICHESVNSGIPCGDE